MRRVYSDRKNCYGYLYRVPLFLKLKSILGCTPQYSGKIYYFYYTGYQVYNVKKCKIFKMYTKVPYIHSCDSRATTEYLLPRCLSTNYNPINDFNRTKSSTHLLSFSNGYLAPIAQATAMPEQKLKSCPFPGVAKLPQKYTPFLP